MYIMCTDSMELYILCVLTVWSYIVYIMCTDSMELYSVYYVY